MSILVTCTCGKNYKLADSLAGRKARCKACGASMIVPEVEVLGDSSLLTLIDDDTPPSPEPEYEAESLGDSSLLTPIDDDEAPPAPGPEYELEQPVVYAHDRPQPDYAPDPSPMFLSPGETMASNPGRMRLSLLQYYKCYRAMPTILIVGLILSVVAAFRFNLGGGAMIAVSMIVTAIWDFRDVQNKCRLGDVNPGVVVSVKPPLVAVLTDLSMTGGAARPALKILRQPLAHMTGGPPRVGMRVPAICQYGGDQNGTTWKDFAPDVINCLTNSAQTVERKLASISPEQWNALSQAVARLPEVKPGMYRLWEPGWQNQPLSLTSSMGKALGAVVILGIAVGIGAILFGTPRDDAGFRPAPNHQPPPEADVAQAPPNDLFANPNHSKPGRANVPFGAGAKPGRSDAPTPADSRPDPSGGLFSTDRGAPKGASTERATTKKGLRDTKSSQPQSTEPKPSETEPAEPGETAPAGTDTTPPSASTVDVGDFKVGDPIEVEWGGKWWPATVVKLKEGKTFVHYEKWSASSDEWVRNHRIRPVSSAPDKPQYKRGDKVEFSFLNEWRPATVVAIDGDRVQVREDGEKFPRWILIDRLRYPPQEK